MTTRLDTSRTAPAPQVDRPIRRTGVLANAVLLQVGWFAAVLGAAHGVDGWGPAFCVAVALVTVCLSAYPARLALLVTLVSLLGVAADALLMHNGWLRFPGWEHALPPLWIAALWPLFATTYDLSFRWLRGRLRLAALLGAVGGPLGYVAADRLGALQLHARPEVSVLALAVAWGLLLPAGLALADRLLQSSRRAVRTRPQPTIPVTDSRSVEQPVERRGTPTIHLST